MIRKLVLDVLKPHKPDLARFSDKISEIEGVKGVNVSLYEIDKEVENAKVTLLGELDYDRIEEKIKDMGGSVHSIDEASAGEHVVEEMETVHERDGKENWLK